MWEPRYNIANAFARNNAFSDDNDYYQQYDQALEHLDKILEEYPKNVPAMLCLLTLVDPLEEISLCRRILEIDGTNKTARMKIEEHDAFLARVYERFYTYRN